MATKKTKKEDASFPTGKLATGGGGERLGFSPDGSCCLISCFFKTMRVDRAGELREVELPRASGDLVFGPVFPAALARSGDATAVQLVDFSGSEVGSAPLDGYCPAFAVSDDGKRIAVVVGDNPCSLQIWETSGRLLSTLPIGGFASDYTPGIVFSPDASRVLFVRGQKLQSWPVDGGTPVTHAAVGVSPFGSLAGNLRLSRSRDGRLLLRRARGGVALFSLDGQPLWEHPDGPSHQVGRISPAGRLIAVASGLLDGPPAAEIRVFDASNGALLRRTEFKCAKKEYAADIDITDDGWVALATNKKIEFFAPEGPPPGDPS